MKQYRKMQKLTDGSAQPVGLERNNTPGADEVIDLVEDITVEDVKEVINSFAGKETESEVNEVTLVNAWRMRMTSKTKI